MMSSKYKVLYHITSSRNYINIVADGGIHPAYAQGRIKRCYYTAKDYVNWAISRCAFKHDWKISELVVLRIKARAWDFVKVGHWPFYATQIVYMPYDVEGAPNWIERTEKAVMKLDWLDNGEFWEHLKDDEPTANLYKKGPKKHDAGRANSTR
jgi:hypothetical protein